MKRISDFVISFMMIIIVLPLILTIGIIIKLDSAGPIFYYRKCSGRRVYRIGKNGKPFYYFKFRSMFVGTEDVTSFGRFIRRWHLDELPELFLVLIGSMSLVGPRPWTRDFLKYKKKIFYESMKAKPGITGPFQIHRQENCSLEDVIVFNNWYAENEGFLTDVKIILLTIPAIIKQKTGIKGTLIVT